VSRPTATGFSPPLDVARASAMDTADHPQWQGIGAVLLRPDGHVGWVGPDTSAESAASLLRALAGWLEAVPMLPAALQGHSPSSR
jgi:hypothetical protein